MKIRLLAALLLIATLFGAFGCAMIPAEDEESPVNVPKENKNFIAADKNAVLSGENNEAQSGNLINLAATDEKGRSLYHIVYNISSSQRVIEQCETLAADIYDVTGVELPILHSSEKTDNQYEIMVGRIARKETVETVDKFDLGESDFTVQIVGTRILIYATNDHALMSAIIFFMDQLAEKKSNEGIYGLAADTKYTYEHVEFPPFEPIGMSEDGKCYDFKLTIGLGMYTFVRLSYTGNSGWRIQTKYSETQDFKDDGASQILAYSMGEYELGTEDARFYRKEISVKETDSEVILTTEADKSRVVINKKHFTMNFYTPSGKVAQTITNITHNAGGGSITGLLNKGEGVYGTGERFNAVNQRGEEIEMFSKDIWSKYDACYMVIPLVCFSRGSGVFLNIYEHMVLKLGIPSDMDRWSASVTGTGIDCYVFTTEEIEDVLNGYSALSGYAGLPEEWTYGMLVCAYSPDLGQKWTADITPSAADGRGEGVYEMIANMEANDLPWTGVLAEPWGVLYSENEQHRQDLRELCDYVHSFGKKFLVYMRVGDARPAMSGFSNEYLLRQVLADGTTNTKLPHTTADTNNPDFGTGSGGLVYLDITNPEASYWLFDEYWNYLVNDIGVDGCKIDFCELLPENYELKYYDKNIPTAGSHHWYPTAFCTMYWDLVSSKPDGGMCYTRGGGIGAQRAPYMWAGDQRRYWAGLSFQLKAVLSSGLSGVPYMSYDMAGYQYGPVDEGFRALDVESEVFVRGTQYTAFTICMQTHGKVLRSYQFMGLEVPKIVNGKPVPLLDENGNQMLDEYGNKMYEMVERVPEGKYEWVTDIYRAYNKLHEHLTPYITELSEEASTTGNPVMRHLVLGWQDDPNVYSIDTQYMLGDAFMVAPILSSMGGKETCSRNVYFPKLEGDAEWIDLETGKTYKGGQKYLIEDISIADLPTFYNPTTKSEIAKELVDGIKEIYAYAGEFVDDYLASRASTD